MPFAHARRAFILSYRPEHKQLAQNLKSKMHEDWGLPQQLIALENSENDCHGLTISPEETLLHVCLSGNPVYLKILHQDKIALRQIFGHWPFDEIENLIIKNDGQSKDRP
jgi:hypothetical protein